ncbi:WD domain-containing protein [Cordyceps militaris CM01]|uniref:WD domain-containing protein n=1 Tax=Cordyceps militaris (strain CM01) TaxID=983644 RepID=G3JJY9_CORMM|nr:WD domain-containing protein [Cordyceps militaris CM01]EGX91326.1 WD domain-containing protein [Cordyceps militaris CM01]
MNLLLSDDYLLQDYPESITGTIRSGHATFLRFNRKGDYLASGRVDGTVIVWDLETMGVARKLRGHNKSITFLSWSRCGRYLLSACQGWRAILWDLKDGSRFREVRFRAPVYMAELHPWNRLAPALVDVSEPVDVKRVLPSAPKRANADERQAKEDAKQMTTSAVWTMSGDHILAGTSKGKINIIDAKTLEIIYSEKICAGAITTLRITGSGRDLLVNSQDRIIRTLRIPNLSAQDLDPDTIQIPIEHKFQDVVNRLSWNHVTFSATGEYVAASTYNNHELYVWERNHGSLVCMLKDPKEEQGVIEWHPARAMLAACGLETGRIYMWSVVSPQKWSALAPDFAEVEENVVYIEKEDEFDLYAQEEIHRRRLDAEDEEVDVMTNDHLKTEDEMDGDEFRMPILFTLGESDSEDEFITVSTGTMRRRSPGDDQSDSHGAVEAVPPKRGAAKGGRVRSSRNHVNSSFFGLPSVATPQHDKLCSPAPNSSPRVSGIERDITKHKFECLKTQ